MPIIRGILEVWGFADGMLREAVIIFGLWCCLVLKLFLPGIGVVFFLFLPCFSMSGPSRSSTILSLGRHIWNPIYRDWWNGKDEGHVSNELTDFHGRLQFCLLPHQDDFSKVGVDDDAYFASPQSMRAQNVLATARNAMRETKPRTSVIDCPL